MSLITHQLQFLSPMGAPTKLITDGGFVSLKYALRENRPGVMDLVLPMTFDLRYLQPDSQIELYRDYGAVPLGLEGDTSWFIRRPAVGVTEDGVSYIRVRAYSACDLLSRRIVAYYAGTSYSEKVDLRWDDMMREVVDENYGPGASYAGASYGGDPERNLEPWFVVEEDQHWGASYTRAMPWKNVLDSLQGIVEDVRSQGIYCAFDVVRVDRSKFEFRVFLGSRGTDHSSGTANAIIVSEDRHNLASPTIDNNWEDEHNFIYSMGQGQKTDRILKKARDNRRIRISPFNRQEFNRDARQAETAKAVQAEANSALEEFRPKYLFEGRILETEGCLYGIHWKWGDIVTAEFRGMAFDCHVEAVSYDVSGDGAAVAEGFLRSVTDVR